MSSEDQQQPQPQQPLVENPVAQEAPVVHRPPSGLNGTNMAAISTANGQAALQRGLEALADTDMENNMEEIKKLDSQIDHFNSYLDKFEAKVNESNKKINELLETQKQERLKRRASFQQKEIENKAESSALEEQMKALLNRCHQSRRVSMPEFQHQVALHQNGDYSNGLPAIADNAGESAEASSASAANANGLPPAEGLLLVWWGHTRKIMESCIVVDDTGSNVAENDEKVLLYTQPSNFDVQVLVYAEKQVVIDANSSENEKSCPRSYTCSECSAMFTSRMEFDEHLNLHPGHKPYICEFCEACFNRRSTLWNHKRIHSDHKPYRCPLCQMQFKWKNSLKCHREMHMRKHDKCGNNGVFDVQAFNKASGYTTNAERGRRSVAKSSANGGKRAAKSSGNSSTTSLIVVAEDAGGFKSPECPSVIFSTDDASDQQQEHFLINAPSPVVVVESSISCLPLPTVCLGNNDDDVIANQQQYVFDNDNHHFVNTSLVLNEYGYSSAFNTCSTSSAVAADYANSTSYYLNTTEELQSPHDTTTVNGPYVKVLPFDQW